MKRYFGILVLLMCGCGSHPKTLVNAPQPGIIGHARFSSDDNSITERLAFLTRVPEAELHRDFETYCRGLGLSRDRRAGTTGIEWWESDRELLGMLVSPNKDGTIWVTYLYQV